MNELLANVYGTGGFEKTASEGGADHSTLADLALAFANEAVEGDDHEKVASAHQEIFDHLVSFDRAGRAIAHHAFSQMEKAAHEGDSSALEAFFGDVIASSNEPEVPDARAAVMAEIERRLA